MNIKKSCFTLALSFFAAFSFAQEKASPPKIAEGMAGGSEITINYSSPGVKGRVIWGELVPLGKVWRAGANEATTFTTSKDILVEGQKLPAGTYSLFIIPGESESTFIFNKVAKQWGAFDYDQSKDQLRVSVLSRNVSELEERLVYEIKPGGFEVRWEYAKAEVEISPVE